MSILEDICFGKYYFEIAIILRDSLLVNSILTNAEAWYDLKKSEIKSLKKVDDSFIRKVLEAPKTTPKEMLYLEMGVIPIRFTIISRRLTFLHYILNQEKGSIIKDCFEEAQLENPIRND